MKKSKKIIFGIMFWLIQLTWGALLTYPGLIICTFCIVFLGGKPHKNGYSFIVEIGDNWGGLEIGACAFCGSYNQKDKKCYSPKFFDHTRKHEFGHNLQQLILGPFQLFIVGIPSATRYWIRRIRTMKDLPNYTAYDDIWFEYYASKWGHKIINLLEDNTDPEAEYTFKRTKK